MSQIPSLVEFLRQSETQLRIFDMGRRVSKLSAETFNKVEQAQVPYPIAVYAPRMDCAADVEP